MAPKLTYAMYGVAGLVAFIAAYVFLYVPSADDPNQLAWALKQPQILFGINAFILQAKNRLFGKQEVPTPATLTTA